LATATTAATLQARGARLRLVGREAAEGPVVLEAAGLALCRRAAPLFRSLSLSLRGGTLTAVVGPSGAGKSSLLALLAGILPADAGTLGTPDGARPRVALVPQDLRLAASETLLTNVLCGALGRHAWWRTVSLLPAEEKAAARDLLARLGVGDLASAPAGRVSGGQQQRAAVARALLQRPDLLLADEPVSQLDAKTGGDVLAALRDAADADGCAVVCVLHDETAAFEAADSVLRLDPSLPDGWRLEEGLA
jgi:phosphonate transport system ATP-binding protein